MNFKNTLWCFYIGVKCPYCGIKNTLDNIKQWVIFMLIIKIFNFCLFKITQQIKNTIREIPQKKEKGLYFSVFNGVVSLLLKKRTCIFILHWSLQIKQLVLSGELQLGLHHIASAGIQTNQKMLKLLSLILDLVALGFAQKIN